MEGRDEPTVIPVERIEEVLPKVSTRTSPTAPPAERDKLLTTSPVEPTPIWPKNFFSTSHHPFRSIQATAPDSILYSPY